MNRNARRAAQARARSVRIDRVTAIHEAGHAVGRLLTADAMGYPVERAVDSIRIGSGSTLQSTDGRLAFMTQAICYGPTLSREMSEAYADSYPGREPISADLLFARLAKLGTQEQRAKLARSRLLFIAMGPAAEARECGDDGCASDRADMQRDVALIGGEGFEADRALEDACSEAIRLVELPAVWNAIKAVAQRAKSGAPGSAVAQSAMPHLEPVMAEARKVA